MINRNRNRVSAPSFIPKWSDPDILKSILNPAFWKLVFLRDRKALWVFIRAMIALKMEMFIAPLRAVFRYNHGRRTTGVIITVMAILMMLAFNSAHFYGILASLFPMLSPALPIVMTSEQMGDFVFETIHSQALLIFIGVYGVLSVFHLAQIFFARRPTHASSKRGTSILYVLVFKSMGMREVLVQRFAEPLISGVSGFTLCHSGADFTFGLFLMIAAMCLFIQECYDGILNFVLTPDSGA